MAASGYIEDKCVVQMQKILFHMQILMSSFFRTYPFGPCCELHCTRTSGQYTHSEFQHQAVRAVFQIPTDLLEPPWNNWFPPGFSGIPSKKLVFPQKNYHPFAFVGTPSDQLVPLRLGQDRQVTNIPEVTNFWRGFGKKSTARCTRTHCSSSSSS